MKRGLVIGVALFALVLVGVFVGIFNLSGFAISSEGVELVETSELVAGNGVCEYYYKQFDVGEEDVISINGEELNIKYLGENNWGLGEHERLISHRLEDYIQKSEFEGVYFNPNMDSLTGKGAFKFDERTYYLLDCLGYSNIFEYTSDELMDKRKYFYEVDISEGWNLVPSINEIPHSCSYGGYNEICDDDISDSYWYMPISGEYYSKEDFASFIENYNISEEEDLFTIYDRLLVEGDDEEIGLYLFAVKNLFFDSSSNWIYVKSDAKDKKFIHFSYYPNGSSNSGPRLDFLSSGLIEEYPEYEIFVNFLNEGWNFLYVQPFMVFDDDLNKDPLTLNEITLGCNIEKAYLFDNIDKSWESIESGEEFTEDMIGKGMIVKVAEDCSLGDGRESVSAPALPEEDFDDIQSCIKSKENLIKQKINDVTKFGSEENLILFSKYQEQEYEYLCHTSEYYKRCILQKPQLISFMKSSIKDIIQNEVKSCINQDNNFNVNLAPNYLYINVIDKNSVNFLNVSLNSNLYNVLLLTNYILMTEAMYGNVDVNELSELYSNIQISKIHLTEGTKIYFLRDKNTNEEFNFATRSILFP